MVWQKVKFKTLNCSAYYYRKTDKKLSDPTSFV